MTIGRWGETEVSRSQGLGRGKVVVERRGAGRCDGKHGRVERRTGQVVLTEVGQKIVDEFNGDVEFDESGQLIRQTELD